MRMIFRTLRRVSVPLAAALLAGGLTAAPPDLVRYQARLADDAGVPVTGTHDLEFAIFDAASGGNELWSEGPRTVSLGNGTLEILLGEVTPLPSSVFTASARWLEVTVDGAVLSPRQRLTSLPFAHAAFAGTFPSVRMCTSEEIMRTPVANWPALPLQSTWVQPAVVGYRGQFLLDFSGVEGLFGDLTCQGWSPSGSEGLLLEGSGTFASTTSCGAPLRVTCCAEGGAGENSCSLHRFVGVTSATTPGNVGWETLNTLCTIQFGGTYPGVRMCTSEDVLHTPQQFWPAIPASAWLHPTVVAIDPASNLYLEISGLRRSSLSCGAWRGPPEGLTITSAGWRVDTDCLSGSGIRVSCCAPP